MVVETAWRNANAAERSIRPEACAEHTGLGEAGRGDRGRGSPEKREKSGTCCWGA